MIARLIEASVKARVFFLLTARLLIVVGVLTGRSTPVDALPDLSTSRSSSARRTRGWHHRSSRARLPIR